MKKNDIKRTSFLRRVPLRRHRCEQLSHERPESPSEGNEKPKKQRKTRKVDLSKRLDMVFSAYIRLRDALPGGMTRCISCGRLLPFEQMQCGHYFSRRSMSTRWHEDNCHSQCQYCNCHLGGNLAMYKAGLLSKIGAERVESLEYLHNQERKWDDDELREMTARFAGAARLLAKEKGINVKI